MSDAGRSATALLRAEGLVKTYPDGDVKAVRGISLGIDAGEFVAITGPSGCGKSTALRTAAGLEEVTEGSIHIGDRDVTQVRPAHRNVSMVFQSYALFPHLSVEENIGFGLRARGVKAGRARVRVFAAAELVGCELLLQRKPYQLSGGERQRVALARALVREPDVHLLDEPLSNLDAQLRVHMRAELKKLHQDVGATMVYVTHDQVEALTLGDRVAVLNRGVLQQLGPPDDVYRRPANRFVAGFIGSPAMNFFPGEQMDGLLRAGPFVFEPTANMPERVEVGVRPEHVHVGEGDEGAPAEVQVVEMAGNETYLHLQADGSPLVARVGADVRPEVGSTVRVRANGAYAYLFDAETGKTLT
jgi:ABC-type sugar transport system ATPase subunit